MPPFVLCSKSREGGRPCWIRLSAEADPLRTVMQKYLGAAASAHEGLVGIAAPHVSPEGGWQSYRAAYQWLTPDLGDRTFVVLGTSHYGEPDRFGLTRKPFETPFGKTRTDDALVSELARQPASLMEDYCHSIEHSIEFQVVFLQSIYGPDVRILPILCGSFARSIIKAECRKTTTASTAFWGRSGTSLRENGPAVLGARRGYGTHGCALRRQFFGICRSG